MVKRLIPHINIILALVTLTFLILGQFNPLLTKMFFQVVLLLFCLAALVNSAFLIACNRKD